MAGSRKLVGALAGASGLLLVFALFVGVLSGRADALVAADVDEAQEADAVQVSSAGPRYLADGTYVFDVGKSSSFVVDVAGSSKKAGAKVVMAEDAASKSQQWVLSWDDQYGAYRIKNARSKLYLTTKAARAGKKLVSQAKYSASNKRQLWVLRKDGAGYKVLSLASKSVGLGTVDAKVQGGSYVTTQSAKAKKFKFYILPVGEDLMKPTAAAPASLDGKFMGISLPSATDLRVGVEGDAATAAVAESSGSQSQKWCLKAVDVDEGVYVIVNLGNGKALQVAGKGRHVGTDVAQAAVKTSDKAQQWWVRSNKKGNYTFTSCYNGLTVRSTSAKAGANVCLGLKSASNRAFGLAEVAPLDDDFYQISTLKRTSLSWGVVNGSPSKNVQLRVSARKGTLLWQKFSLENVKGSVYAIRSVTSNRYIGETGGKVVQGTRSASSSQRWEITWKANGFVLRNVRTGHYLSVSGSVKSGAKLVASASYKASTSKLVFTKCRLIEDGTYFLTQGGNANKVMGISQADAKKEKAAVGVFKKANVQSYKFEVTHVDEDSAGNEIYQIRNTYSGQYLTASGSRLFQKSQSNSKAQRWQAIVTSTGMIAFKNLKTGKAMSLSSKSVKTASYNAKSSARFRWSLEATSSLTPEQLRAYDMVAATFSNTKYAVTADLSNHRVRIWKRANASSPWTLKYDWICSNGKPATPTPAVNLLSTGSKRFRNAEYRPDGTYWTTSFYYMTYIASGKYFHSPIYKKHSMTRVADGRMGRSISNGCVRLQMRNAIWIYKNIKRGTRIITYY